MITNKIQLRSPENDSGEAHCTNIPVWRSVRQPTNKQMYLALVTAEEGQPMLAPGTPVALLAGLRRVSRARHIQVKMQPLEVQILPGDHARCVTVLVGVVAGRTRRCELRTPR